MLLTGGLGIEISSTPLCGFGLATDCSVRTVGYLSLDWGEYIQRVKYLDIRQFSSFSRDHGPRTPRDYAVSFPIAAGAFSCRWHGAQGSLPMFRHAEYCNPPPSPTDVGDSLPIAQPVCWPDDNG